MSSHSALGGHVEVADHVNVGWGSGVHQFCRIGDYAMVGAASKVVQDVPPYMISDGNPAEVRTPNKIGLERAGFSKEAIAEVRRIFKIFYKEGFNRRQAAEKLEAAGLADSKVVANYLNFLKTSERGLS